GFPTLARRRDLAANVHGAGLMGIKRVGSDEGTGGLESIASHDGIVLVLGDPLTDQDGTFGASAALYVYLGYHASEATRSAHFVLPVTTFAEQEGTFTNLDGRVQRFWPALHAPGMARPAWLVVGALVAQLADQPTPRSAAEAFAALSGAVSAFSGLGYDDIGARGAIVNQVVSVTGD
ncbi:MAG TPA: molybdopterin-dependent oxidoreductase, partial [Longimicrobiales bacterium]|nr:molybdopterin-dependent oxidoreductase [Longimicrobiales bacterium]